MYTKRQQHVSRRPYQAGSSTKFPEVPMQLLPNAQLCSAGVTLKPQNNEQMQRKSQLQLKTNTHLFPSNFQLKYLNNSIKVHDAQFELISQELGSKHKCIFQEGVMLFLWKFWQDRDCCVYN